MESEEGVRGMGMLTTLLPGGSVMVGYLVCMGPYGVVSDADFLHQITSRGSAM